MKPALRVVAAILLTVLVISGQEPLHLTLAEAEKQALQNHPVLAAQKYTAAASREVIKEARSSYQPAFTATLSAVGADDSSRIAAIGLNNSVVYSRLGTGVQVSQMVTDFGRTGNLVASARFRAEAEDKSVEAARADVLLEVDRAYFALLKAQALLKVADMTVKDRQLIHDQVSALAENQLRSSLDLSFAKVNLSEGQLILSSAQNGVASARARLATAMGIPGEQNFSVDDTGTPGPPPDKVMDLVREALRERPDAGALRLELSAAERFANAERALSYPSVGIVATAGFVPAGPAELPNRFGAAGVAVTLPVFNGGLYTARRSEAELRSRAIQQRVRALENRITQNVQIAYRNALTAYERIGLTAQLMDQAKLSLELAERRYELGLSSIIELSQAQLNLTNAEIAGTSARYDYQAENAVLRYQMGDLR